MSARRLTARGVKTMLARRGVDYSALELTETVNDFEVRIDGPRDARKAATQALVLDIDGPPGMSLAPYPDHDFLIRR